MFTHEKKIDKLFLYWLIITLILVFFIIIIGGLTRLTNSGLSITEWELFKGILPPLNEKTWLIYFNLYKEIPQYKLLNNDMNLNDFKIIFYWEYLHRMIARIIGIFFLIPLLFFYYSKKINKFYMRICFLIFFLILFQGIVGWFMVKSGLIDNITVSHYRLAIHLIIAFIIISILFWLINNVIREKNILFLNFTKNNFFYLFLIFLIFIQIILGAFVSGLDAGRIYQTWPYMGSSYIPNDITFYNFEDAINFNNHSLVQFYHRNFAYLILIYIFALSIYIFKKRLVYLFKPLKFLIFFLTIQIFLGISTLLSNLDIFIASAHQISSVLLVFSAINLYYHQTK